MIETKLSEKNILLPQTKINMGTALLWSLSGFTPIDLTELNATASYLKRIDRKFLVTEKELISVLKDLKNDFRTLEIGDKRIFDYDNVYMDTQDYLFYKQHQEEVPGRTKVRTRHYIDSGDLAFFEYKQKENGITKKFRYQFPAVEHGTMTKGKKRFFDGVWQSLYGTKAPEITPAMKTAYKRLTLVSKNGEERLTIDFDIVVKDLRNEHAQEIRLENVVIIESKSLSDNCISVKTLESKGIARANSCSKYSLGVIYSGLAEKWSKFQETMNKIQDMRMEVQQEQRKKHMDQTQRLSNRFKKTSLKEVSQTA